MIFDRTIEDINAAISIRADKVQKGVKLTESDIIALERGTLTYNTLNRIENKQEELKNLFYNMGYMTETIINKLWDNSGIYSQAEFDRLIENTEKLKRAFFVYLDTPIIPNNNYRQYNTMNAVEKILYDVDVMINDIKSHYRICGVAVCGE